jgi:hypothetical protein
MQMCAVLARYCVIWHSRWSADAPAWQKIASGLQLEHAAADRGLADPGRHCYRPHPAMAQQPRFLPQH